MSEQSEQSQSDPNVASLNSDLERLLRMMAGRGDRSGLPASLAHLRRARVVELGEGADDDDEKTDVTEKTIMEPDSDSSSDNDDDGEHGASSDVDISLAAGVIESVAETLRSESQAALGDKVLSMVHLQEMIFKMNNKKRGKIATQIVSSGLLDIWVTMMRNRVPGASSEKNLRWKMMEIIYQLLVKITDNSNEFSQQVASTDLIKYTIGVLKNRRHQANCAEEPFLAVTTWMIELIGNCYGDIDNASMQEECRELVDTYLQVRCESIQIKAGQTKMCITLKDQLPHRASSIDGVSGGSPKASTRTKKSPGQPKKSTEHSERNGTGGTRTHSEVLDTMLSELRQNLEQLRGLVSNHQGGGEITTGMLRDLQENLMRAGEGGSGSQVEELNTALSGLKDKMAHLKKLKREMFSGLLENMSEGSEADGGAQTETLNRMLTELQENVAQDLSHLHARGGGENSSSSQAETLDRMLSDLRENMAQHLGGDGVSDSMLSELLENLAPGLALNGKLNETEAERMCRKGMPRVYTETIKEWYSNPQKWGAFNEDGKMWDSIKEAFDEMVKFGKVSPKFSKAMCEAGIVEVLQSIMSNGQIQEAYMRNGKTREVVAGCLVLLLHAAHLKSAQKYLDVTRIWDILQGYLICDDADIRGRAILIVANLAKLDTTRGGFNMKFSTSDVVLLIATNKAFESDGESLGNFLANTNFPELCVRELRNCLTRDAGNEVIQDEEWGELLQILAALHLFSSRSEEFAKSVVMANVVEPLQNTLASTYMQAREREQRCSQLLKVLVLLIHNCVRLSDPVVKSRFLVPNLWPHIYPSSAIRNTEDHKHFAAFFAFAHMHALVSDGTSRPVTIDRFPKLSRSFEDIKYLNNLWHTAKAPERSILGDFVAATGGAAVHVALLGDMVTDMNSITSNEDKFKPLLANMNNLAMRSSAFAEEMCRSGLLGHLKTILSRNGIDLTNIKDAEQELLDYCISTAHACAQYTSSMQYFQSADISMILSKYMMTSVPQNMRRRAMTAVIFIHIHDPQQVAPCFAHHRVSSLSQSDLHFYTLLEASCTQEKIVDKAGDFLVELGVAGAMCRKLQLLVRDATLLKSFALTGTLMRCLVNYAESSEQFTMALRDIGIFETCQEVIRNPEYKDNLTENENIKSLVSSALGILLNCAQYEGNHAALYNLRVLNDLLQFTQARDLKIKAISTLGMSLLIREENANLVRSSSKSGVIPFLLEKLDAGINDDDDDTSNSWTPMALLNGLSNIALNDGNKVVLVYDGILPILSNILVKGNPKEKLLAAHLAWSLAFQEDTKCLIQRDQPLLAVLHSLSAKSGGETKVKAMGALCQLEITNEKICRIMEKQARVASGSSEYEMGNCDILLSYHPTSKLLFSEMKTLLEREGFSVTLINHDSANDDIFAQMTSAIDKSKVIITEVSRQYQRSLFCRTEAEYSHRLLKPMVPLRSEHGFKPVGWLATVCSGRTIINFSRNLTGNEHEGQVTRLLKEVKRTLRQGQSKE